jgi:hypothetical protein
MPPIGLARTIERWTEIERDLAEEPRKRQRYRALLG